uniref:Uncharacterized protein n=1 Tax=Arundo donax TaxID=35708 RepID=A0A0A8YR36_ARUDO
MQPWLKIGFLQRRTTKIFSSIFSPSFEHVSS